MAGTLASLPPLSGLVAAAGAISGTTISAFGALLAALAAFVVGMLNYRNQTRQLAVAREGQLTERFTRAVEQLGNDNPDVRIGGIYALEQIANASPRDRRAIIEVLTAFVQGHAPWPPRRAGQPSQQIEVARLAPLRSWAPDVQAAMTVLGRRPIDPAEEPLNLTDVDLRMAELPNVNLRRAKLHRCGLQRIILHHADLEGAELPRVLLQGADLRNASFRGARIRRSNLRDADLGGADLRNADLEYADLRGSTLGGTDLTDALVRDAAFGGAKKTSATRFPDGFDPAASGVVDLG